MKISELGEFGLISTINQMIGEYRGYVKRAWQNVVIGIGDDAAVFQTDRKLILSTIDTLVEGIHFNAATLDWAALGWKALAISLSDIAAMGGRAENVLVALALPENTDVENIKKLYGGLLELASTSGVAVIGGNISRSPLLCLTTSVCGSTENREKLMLRGQAHPGDKVAVTGYPGMAACGFKILSEGIVLDLATTKVLHNAFLRPRPQLAEGKILVKHGIRTAIDTSDGLLSDLKHILCASGMAAHLDIGLLPLNPILSVHFPDEALGWMLSGGEDYGLLFTGSEHDILRSTTEMPTRVSIIGEIKRGTPGDIILTSADGLYVPLPPATGWRHF